MNSCILETEQQEIPEAATNECWDVDCDYLGGTSYDVANLPIDFTSCISPPPPYESCVEISGGLSIWLCEHESESKRLIVDELIQFIYEITSEVCYPADSPPFVDSRCIYEKATDFLIPYHLQAWGSPIEDEEVIQVDSYRYSCHRYCEESIPGSRAKIVRILDCGEGTSCCVKRSFWKMEENGSFTLVSTSYENLSECNENFIDCLTQPTGIPSGCQPCFILE